MDPEIQELRAQISRLEKTAIETNKSVRKMRSSQRRQMVIRFLWWALVLGLSAYSYLTYVQPRVDQIMSTYDSAKSIQVQIGEWLAQFGPKQSQ